jgi:hypothetical protein
METRARVLLLTALLPLAGCASLHWPWSKDQAAAEEPVVVETDDTASAPPSVIEPQVERRKVKVASIGAENIEVGAYFGALSIEDFGTNNVYGVRAAYHVTEDFFFEANVGRSTAGQTSYETLSGNVQLLTDDERRFTYYSLSLGYNLFPGEVYLGRGLTVNFGAGYRVLPTDWLAIHIDVQDLVFQSDLLGKDKLTNNIGAYLGATVFF